MRRAAVSLLWLLSLCWTWAQAENGGATGNNTEVPTEIQDCQSSSQANTRPNIWAELKELRDMAIEQRLELKSSRSQMEKLQQENAGDAHVAERADKCQRCFSLLKKSLKVLTVSQLHRPNQSVITEAVVSFYSSVFCSIKYLNILSTDLQNDQIEKCISFI